MSYRYGIPVPLLQQIIDSQHFEELRTEERIEPHGERRGDFQAALIAWAIAKGNGAKNLKISDVAGILEEEFRTAGQDKPGQSIEAQKLAAMALCAALGGTINGQRVGQRFEHPPLPRTINPQAA